MSDSSASSVVDVPSLHELCRTGDSVTLASLLDSLDDPAYSDLQLVLEATSEEGASPLHLALLNAHPAVVEVLLKAGSSVVEEFEGSKPIHLSLEMCGTDAYRDRCFECLKMLISRQPDVDAQDREGRTAAHIAAFKGSPEALSLLTTQDINVLVGDAEGKLATHKAVEGHQDECLRVLLEEFGSELLLVPDSQGDLLTHLAARRGAWDCLTLLLELGSYAYLTVPNRSGATTEAVAAECGFHSQYRSIVKGQLPGSLQRTLLVSHRLAKAVDCFQLDELANLLKTDFNEARTDWQLNAPPAFVADVLRVHDLPYVTSLKEGMAYFYGDESAELQQVAMAFAGCVVYAIDSLVGARYKNAVCVLPASSHVGANGSAVEPFVYNSVGIAAAYARYRHRSSISKISILDLCGSAGLDSILSGLTPSHRVFEEKQGSTTFKLKVPFYKPWLDSTDAACVQLLRYGTHCAGASGNR